MNFELLLLTLTGISGLIWLIDYFVFKFKGHHFYEKIDENNQKKPIFFC